MLICIIMYVHINKSFIYLICGVSHLSVLRFIWSSPFIFTFWMSRIFFPLLSLHHDVRLVAHWPPPLTSSVRPPPSRAMYSTSSFLSRSIILSASSTSSSLLTSSRPLPRPSLRLALFNFFHSARHCHFLMGFENDHSSCRSESRISYSVLSIHVIITNWEYKLHNTIIFKFIHLKSSVFSSVTDLASHKLQKKVYHSFFLLHLCHVYITDLTSPASSTTVSRYWHPRLHGT